jgi:hypothetical protein
MEIDPVQEWQRLTAEYRQKYDGELLELARDCADLTQPAQQALGAEMRSRGLGDPANPKSVAPQKAPRELLQSPLALNNAPSDLTDNFAVGAFGARAPELVSDTPDSGDETDAPHEYTWKTELCELDTPEEAYQLQEVLNRAAIESWIRFNGFTYRYVPSMRDDFRMGLGGLQVLVAADQLDQARAIASQPIPQDIIEDSETEIPEYKVPKCPKCGAEDPILESVEPSNTWHCEQCDAQWTESPPAAAEESPKA